MAPKRRRARAVKGRRVHISEITRESETIPREVVDVSLLVTEYAFGNTPEPVGNALSGLVRLFWTLWCRERGEEEPSGDLRLEIGTPARVSARTGTFFVPDDAHACWAPA